MCGYGLMTALTPAAKRREQPTTTMWNCKLPGLVARKLRKLWRHEHPHDTPPYPFMPSPTSANSSGDFGQELTRGGQRHDGETLPSHRRSTHTREQRAGPHHPQLDWWQPEVSRLISRKGNEILNKKFDVSIGNAYRNIMAAVDGKRDHGNNQPAEVWTSSGVRSYFRLGEPIRRIHPVIQEGPNGVTILERRKKDARRALVGKLAKIIRDTLCSLPAGAESPRVNVGLKGGKSEQFPVPLNASKKEIQHIAEQIADRMMNEAEYMPPEDKTIFLGTPAGPSISFPTAYVMVSLYAAHFGVQPGSQFREYVEAFDPANVKRPPSTFYFMPDPPIFGTDAQLAHQLVLIASAAHKSVFGYVSIFGIAEVVVVLPHEGSSDFTHSYAVDVLTGRRVSVRNIEAAKALLPFQPTPEPGAPCFQAIGQRFGRVRDLIQKMIQEN
jgi:hypothetical protein